MKDWFILAIRSQVVRRSALIALVVGTILNMINYGDAVFCGLVNTTYLFKMGLTYTVPYCVSTISSVGAMREQTTAESQITKGA